MLDNLVIFLVDTSLRLQLSQFFLRIFSLLLLFLCFIIVLQFVTLLGSDNILLEFMLLSILVLIPDILLILVLQALFLGIVQFLVHVDSIQDELVRFFCWLRAQVSLEFLFLHKPVAELFIQRLLYFLSHCAAIFVLDAVYQLHFLSDKLDLITVSLNFLFPHLLFVGVLLHYLGTQVTEYLLLLPEPIRFHLFSLLFASFSHPLQFLLLLGLHL